MPSRSWFVLLATLATAGCGGGADLTGVVPSTTLAQVQPQTLPTPSGSEAAEATGTPADAQLADLAATALSATLDSGNARAVAALASFAPKAAAAKGHGSSLPSFSRSFWRSQDPGAIASEPAGTEIEGPGRLILGHPMPLPAQQPLQLTTSPGQLRLTGQTKLADGTLESYVIDLATGAGPPRAELDSRFTDALGRSRAEFAAALGPDGSGSGTWKDDSTLPPRTGALSVDAAGLVKLADAHGKLLATSRVRK